MAVDLGTANTLVYVRGKGIVLDEPSIVAMNTRDGRLLAVGTEAKRMLGRTPGHIEAIRPLKDGVIADFDICEKMLRYFIQRVHQRKWAKPRMVICIPSGITGVERRAVQEAAEFAGARKPVLVIEEPMAAAIGAGLPVHEPAGNMIVDIGGGTTEVAVISLGGIVVSESSRVGGDEFDEAIINFVKREYSLALGERTAEEVKVQLASAWPLEEELYAEVRGRDLVTGLPKTIVLSTVEIREAVEEPTASIVDSVKVTLDQTPPELAADIMEKGIVITGGGAQLIGIENAIQAETGMPVHRAKHPLYSVVLGSGQCLENFDVLQQVLSSSPAGLTAPAGRLDTVVVYRHDRRRRLTLVLLVITSLALISLDERGSGIIDSARTAAQDVVAPLQNARRRRDQPGRRLVRRARARQRAAGPERASCAASSPTRAARSRRPRARPRAWPSSSRSSTSRASTTPTGVTADVVVAGRGQLHAHVPDLEGQQLRDREGLPGRGRRHRERRRARRPGRVGVADARRRAPHRRPQLRCGRRSSCRAPTFGPAGHRDRAVAAATSCASR